MASITFNTLIDTSKTEEDYTFVDYHLDLAENKIGPQSTFIETTGPGRDIQVNFDLNAIRNSLRNLFSTSPGERVLLPTYGADLRQYIFEPVSESVGSAIGRTIRGSLEKWEPRVTLLNLDITGIADRNEYIIEMTLGIPFLNEPLNVRTIFTREGFVF